MVALGVTFYTSLQANDCIFWLTQLYNMTTHMTGRVTSWSYKCPTCPDATQPTMVRDVGIIMNYRPKIQQDSPNGGGHVIIFPETVLQIPLSLWGILSHFPVTKLKHDVLVDLPDVYILTPTVWNPHTDVYATHEESMMDWEDNMSPERD